MTTLYNDFNVFLKTVLFTMFASFLLCSCEKEMNLKTSVKPSNGTIPYYASMSDVYRAIESYDEDSTIINPNFLSFGQASDCLYYSIYDTADLSNFTLTDAELKVRQHGQYLELLEDQQGEYTFQPKLSNCIFRYVINTERLMRVGDTIYKFFDKGFASCLARYCLDSLTAITDYQFDNFNDNDTIGGILIRKFAKGGGYLGDYLEYSKIQGKEKIETIIALMNSSRYAYYFDYELIVQTRGYQKWLFWWKCKRNLSHDLTVEYYINNHFCSHYFTGSKNNTRYLSEDVGPYQFTYSGPTSYYNYITSVYGFTKADNLILYIND